MPWKNQGGGPWGSGPKGPWGSGSAIGPDRGRPISRICCGKGPGPAAAAAARRLFQRHGHRAHAGRGAGDLGLVRFLPRAVEELGVVLRFGKHVRTVQPGLNYHLPYPIETVLTAEGAARHRRCRVGMSRRSTTRRARPHHARCAGREPDAHRRREHRRRRLHRAVAASSPTASATSCSTSRTPKAP